MCCYLAAVFLPVAIPLDSLNGYMKEQLECILDKELIASGYPARTMLGTLEVRHPRCVGSITKNVVYYTYSPTQLYFT